MVELPWNAFFFEAPPVNKELIGRKFEFVCIDAPCLDSEAPADVYSFSDKFLLAPFSRVTTFSNLGSDALLVTPCPDGSRAPENYNHLASFVRGADPLQRELWWAECGRRALDRINALESRDEYVWLSTSGLHVRWLHMRLDSRPKYYRNVEYREEVKRARPSASS
jgi:hypothetical protein